MELHVKLHSFLVDSKAHSKGIWLLAQHMEMESIVSELHVQLHFCMLSVPLTLQCQSHKLQWLLPGATAAISKQ